MATTINHCDSGLVAIRGGGDIATGVIQKFQRAGFRVAVLEIPRPTAIRRSVALSSALEQGEFSVEDLNGLAVSDLARAADSCARAWADGKIPILADPQAQSLAALKPLALVDATLFKRNRELPRPTTPDLAPVTVGLGPGFSAPEDVDAVIETMRGHSLGSLILKGRALPNTGVPGDLGGKSAERVVHAPLAGIVSHCGPQIGDRVRQGETLFLIGSSPVPSPLDGTVRGLIQSGLNIPKGFKCADVDPRPAEEVDWRTISDKARCLGGAALEAVLFLARRKGLGIRLEKI